MPAMHTLPHPTCSEFEPGLSLGRAWESSLLGAPARTALIFEEQSWTYRALGLAASDAAQTLEARGVRHCERVMLMMDNGPGFLAMVLGCQLLGAIAVPVSPKSAVERITYLAQDSAACVIVVDAAMNLRTRALHAEQAYGERMLDWAARQATSLRAPCAQANTDCAFIQYTSGSTGAAKGVMVSHAAALANIDAFCATLQLRADDVFCSLLPLFHDMGLVCFGLAPLFKGCPLVLHRQESLSLYGWLESVAHYRATLSGAPDSLLQIANRVVEDPAAYDLSSLRALICGSEPVRHDTLRQFGERFGVTHALKPAYGMAELTLCATLTSPADAYRVSPTGDVASGTAIGGVRVWIRGPQGQLVQTADTVGEIVIESPARMQGYWSQAAATNEALDSAGRVNTGDVGYLDEDGYLYVVGRQKNLLIRGGEKYSPHEIETAAQTLPAVRRAGVVQLQGGRHPIVAVLEVERTLLREPARLGELAGRLRQLAHQRAGIGPDCCWFVSGGTIPLTENGKMQHGALRQRIADGSLQALWADHPLEHDDAATTV